MPVGIQVLNPETGKVILDSNNLMYGLVKSGYGTLTNYSHNSGLFLYSFTVDNATSPVFFIEGVGYIQSVTRSGNSFTCNLVTYPPGGALVISSEVWNAEEITGGVVGSYVRDECGFYVFDVMKPNKSRMGLEIFNPETGQVVFNSEQSPLNIATTYHNPTIHWSRVTKASRGIPSTSLCAWTHQWTRGAAYESPEENFNLVAAYGADGPNIGTGWIPEIWTNFWYSNPTYNGVYGAFPQAPVMTVIDVTNLPFPFIY